MNELDSILNAWSAARSRGDTAVLATVVHVKGSAYRRPGARMLLISDGTRIGSISGGCLEGDVVKKAWWLTEELRPAIRVYDTTSDDDAVWEFGLGCNGVVQVLLERLETEAGAELIQFLTTCRSSNQVAAIATLISNGESAEHAPGDRLWRYPNGQLGGRLRGSALETALHCELLAAAGRRESRHVRVESLQFLVEAIVPPVALAILGGGHDAVPLATIGIQLGWEVTVADGRPAYSRPERFPGAHAVVQLPFECPAAAAGVSSDSAVVIMTHDYSTDKKLLQELIPLRPRYLGVLGPRARTVRMLQEIGAHSAMSWIHAPIGLDIGAETPEAIALSIVAEIQATLAQRDGRKLSERAGPIHTPVEERVFTAA